MMKPCGKVVVTQKRKWSPPLEASGQWGLISPGCILDEGGAPEIGVTALIERQDRGPLFSL